MTRYIGKNHVGKFHMAIGPNAAWCNSRNRGLAMGVAHVSNVARAKPEHFCVKCFGEERASAAIGFAAFLVGTAKGE